MDTVSVSNPNAFTRILLKWQRKSHEPVPITEINKTIFFIRLNVYKKKNSVRSGLYKYKRTTTTAADSMSIVRRQRSYVHIHFDPHVCMRAADGRLRFTLQCTRERVRYRNTIAAAL